MPFGLQAGRSLSGTGDVRDPNFAKPEKSSRSISNRDQLTLI